MTTFFAPFAKSSGSLAALAAALALAAPAAAQDQPTLTPDGPAAETLPAPAPAPARALRPMRAENAGGPARTRIYRQNPEAPPHGDRPAFARPAPIAPTFAPDTQPLRTAPDGEARAALGQRWDGPRGGRGRRGGFDDGATRPQGGQREQQGVRRAEPAADPDEPRADRAPAWRGERAAGRRGGWQGERRDRGEVAGEPGWQSRRDAAGAGGSSGWQGGRDRAGDDRRANWRDRNATQTPRRDDGVTGRGDRDWNGGVRDVARDGRRDNWRRDNWRDDRRDNWRDDRRDDWRRNGWHDGRRSDWYRDRRDWRRDDWRWSWNGRAGWDRRDFRRWDNRWRTNRSYNWFDYRRSNRIIYSPGPYYAPFRSHRYSRLSIGWFLDSLFFQPRFFINDPWAYRLPPAYGPYQWVRYYDDVLLVDIYTGEVVDVINDFFW